MAVLKCKMCGGTLDIEQGKSVCTCLYCGSKQTVPRIDDDRRADLYDRANHFRRDNEYDKAMAIYEQILNEDKTDAESYWCIVLCKYGIEYVEDPVKHKRVPTVNRVQYTPVISDDDYKKALEYADVEQKVLYQDEARAIDEIQKSILEVSEKEEPFDVFICYKETDNSGRRTEDSVIANDLYQQLAKEGYKVFFSRITLEDKLGTAYEPYIFAALNSAKVMVVLGTNPEYYTAPWVKNEWSRYLSLIKKGENKTLIPAYKYMKPNELPPEFAYLQAQDMNNLGFIQDMIRGIKKIAGDKAAENKAKQEELDREIANRKAKHKKKTIAIILGVVVVLIIASVIFGPKLLKLNQQYNVALGFEKSGQYEQAYSLFSSLDGYRDSEELMIRTKYERAVQLRDDAVQSGESVLFESSIEMFSSIIDYSDSAEQIEITKDQMIRSLPVGSIFHLGEYNGNEIEWIVVYREEGRILVVQRDNAVAMRFDDDSNDYETSEIRDWLVNDFYPVALSGESSRVIIDEETQDPIFLLSREQAQSVVLDHSLGCFWLRDSDNTMAYYSDVNNRRELGRTIPSYGEDIIYARGAMWLSVE